MIKPKFIEKKNLPLRLAWQEHPQFFIYEFVKEGNNYKLHYLIDERGMSVHFEDKVKFDKFPHYFAVQSGGWYGDNGRWAPVERYSGTIICENVSSFKELSKVGVNFKFEVRKAFISSTKTVIIESEKVGKIELKCKKIVPQEYEIFFKSKKENRWVLRSYALKNLDSYFNEQIEDSPF